MRKEKFYDKFKNTNIDERELERKYFLYLQEQENLRMLYEAARQAQSAPSAPGGGGGEISGGIYMEFYKDLYPDGIPEFFSDPVFWTGLLQVNGDNMDQEVTSAIVVDLTEAFSVTIAGPTELIIPQLMFSDNKNPQYFLKVISDPEGIIKDVRYAAFSNNDGLKAVSLPGCTILDYAVFSWCEELNNVYMPALTTSGGINFFRCTGLQAISLPNLGNVGSNDFDGCISLTYVELPIATSIAAQAFGNCTLLVEISLPEATDIGDLCFIECSSLANVSIPNCINLGSTVDNDQVFRTIDAKDFTLTIDSSRETCNGGFPDGDITSLIGNMAPNTVTINYV